MPLRVVNRIVIDPTRRAEGLSSICAAREHHVTASGKAGRLNAGKHVNIVVRTRARTVRRQKNLTYYSLRINPASNDPASEVNCGALVENGHYCAILCVGGANAPNLIVVQVYAADKKIAV